MPSLLKDVELEKNLQLKLKRRITDALRNATPGHLVMRRKYYYWRKEEDWQRVTENLIKGKVSNE